jgi:Holliday junction DNA helicase RuvB
MNMPSPPLSPERQVEDQPERALRPKSLNEFIGQSRLCRNLRVFIQSALDRCVALDHVLFSGAPGLGKTTLASLIAQEMGTTLHSTSGPVLSRAGDLAALLTNLQSNDVLFIDEIHRLGVAVEELLYQAMEDYRVDIMVGEGPHARSVRLTLSPFTLVGATTRAGLLTRPLRDRFGILENVSFYGTKDLTLILRRAAEKQNLMCTDEALEKLAACARGTPRIALRLLRRTADFAVVDKVQVIELPLVRQVLQALGVDNLGLDILDRKYLNHMACHFRGGPVGIETLAAALFEERRTLEDVVEPYLMQEGFLCRTPQGRIMTEKAYQHLDLPTTDQLGKVEPS